MLHLARGERLGVDVADLLKFQTALERDGVIEAAANEEGILGVCVLAGKPLDTLLVGQGLFDLLGQSLQLGDEMLILTVRQRAAHTGKLGSQQVAGRQLGAVGFGGGDGDFRPAQVYIVASASRAMLEPTTFTMPMVRTPRSLHRRRAASVSAVSPLWLMTIASASFSSTGLR